MTVLNIQSPAFLGYGVIIWQVFIRMLGYYGAKAVGSIVKKLCKTQVTDGTATSSLNNLQSSCNTQCVGWSGTLSYNNRTNSCKTQVSGAAATLPLSLCDREQLLTSERVIRDSGEGFIGCQEVRKARGQAGLEVKKLRRYDGRLFTVKSLSFYPPTLLSSDNPLPQSLPQWREAEKSTSRFTLHTSLKKQVAFTLAEVLITLGIIGVVAALTMPSLIANHTKSVVEARLEKFYSSMNQAIRMAELDYGPRETWFEDNTDLALKEAWIKKYIIPYMNVVKTDTIRVVSENYFTVYFSDGSAAAMATSNGRDWFFFPGNPERCVSSSPTRHYKDFVGRCAFAFFYNPVPKSTGDGFVQWNFEPYMASWDGKENSLKNHSTYGCNENSSWSAFCTRWIQYNGWKIPKDYPFRVKYR